jgi:DNA-binding CsgD family transcriptional regulator
MQNTELFLGVSAGFILLDSSMNPISVNRLAAEILGFPQKQEAGKKFNDFLASRIRAVLTQNSARGLSIVSEFRSGKRLYLCRTFRVDSGTKRHHQPSIAVLIERGSSAFVSLAGVTDKFHLTAREQEVLQSLLLGLTSKEIAVRMTISANTVKAFLHLIMIKMGVSTRSGIVGKCLVSKSEPPPRAVHSD